MSDLLLQRGFGLADRGGVEVLVQICNMEGTFWKVVLERKAAS